MTKDLAAWFVAGMIFQTVVIFMAYAIFKAILGE